MAEISLRSDGIYKIRVYLGKDTNGKRITESTTFKTTKKTTKAIEKEVFEFAMEFEKKIREGEILLGDKLTFTDVIEEWKKSPVYKNLTKSSQESYLEMLEKRVNPHIGYMKINKITPRHIQKIYNDMVADGKAPKTVKRTNTAINSVMTFSYKSQIIKENPCTRIYLPKNNADTDLHYFTLEQAQRFLKCLSETFTINHPSIVRKNGRVMPEYTETITIGTQFKVYFYLSVYGGFRRGELIALTWNDINFKKRTISINKAIAKTKEEQIVKTTKTVSGIREIMLPSECFQYLKQWKYEQMEMALMMGNDWKGKIGKDFNENNIFIQLENGLRMDVDTPSHKFKKIIQFYNSSCENEEDKLPEIRLHDLRHTSATLLLANGTDIETVSHRLGHSKPSITLDVYGHWMEETDNKASDTLENLFSKAVPI